MNFWRRLPKPIKILAPMDDVTDVVFRNIVVECARPDVFFTEFTSTDGLFSKGAEKVARRLKFLEIERPIVAQIWGNNPENYLKAAKLLNELGFDGIDINMGCPVDKVAQRGACSALIENPTLAKELILACKEGAKDLPVSVKTRIGFKIKKTDEWASFLLELEPAAITVHGRTAKQKSKVPADWGEIAKFVALRDQLESKTIIIGNGDVVSHREINEMYKTYGVDGVMIGRGIFQDPFIFSPNKSINDLTLNERLDLLLKHARLFVEVWGDTKNFAILKKFFKIYVSGFESASDLRVKLMECKSLSDVELVIMGSNNQ